MDTIESYCILTILNQLYCNGWYRNLGFSQRTIPKICEQCWKPFEAKTVVTRFCGSSYVNKSGKEKNQEKYNALLQRMGNNEHEQAEAGFHKLFGYQRDLKKTFCNAIRWKMVV